MKTIKFVLTGILFLGIGYAIGNASKNRRELSELSISELNEKLKSLVAAEDYETASIVRDVINKKKSVSA